MSATRTSLVTMTRAVGDSVMKGEVTNGGVEGRIEVGQSELGVTYGRGSSTNAFPGRDSWLGFWGVERNLAERGELQMFRFVYISGRRFAKTQRHSPHMRVVIRQLRTPLYGEGMCE